MKIKCTACNGTGYYDDNNNPSCGACEGKGYIKLKKKAWIWITCASPSDARRVMSCYATESDVTQLKLGVNGTTFGFWYR